MTKVSPLSAFVINSWLLLILLLILAIIDLVLLSMLGIGILYDASITSLWTPMLGLMQIAKSATTLVVEVAEAVFQTLAKDHFLIWSKLYAREIDYSRMELVGPSLIGIIVNTIVTHWTGFGAEGIKFKESIIEI